MKFGAHMSTAGGVWRALERARTAGADIVQIFVKNNMQWLGRAPLASDLSRYTEVLAETRLAVVFGHTGYLINLAAPSHGTQQSVNCPGQGREEQVKPGAWLGAGAYELARIGDGADARSFDSRTQRFEAGQSFAVKMLPYGGFVATLKPAK